MDFTIGQILVSALDFAPTGTLTCNSQLAPVSANRSLFELLGTTYGGDGVTTFGVPDIVARFGPTGPPVGFYIVADGAPYQSGMEALLGECRLFPTPPAAGSTLALTWLPCDGRLLALDQQSEKLFSLIGTVYGGDGIKTFALPKIPPLVVAKGPPLPYWICISGVYPSAGGDAVTPTYTTDQSYDTYIGTLLQLAYGAGPAVDQMSGVALCRGQTLPIADPWLPLFSLLGIRLGGNGTTTFALPTLAPGPAFAEGSLMVIESMYPPRS